MIDHGIIILQPYAGQIINGRKKWEYRSKDIPRHYLNRPVYLLSEGMKLGIIQFTKSIKFEDDYKWKIQLITKFKNPIPYKHRNGVQVWMRDVDKSQGVL